MSEAARNRVITQFDAWRSCVRARSRIVYLLRGAPASRYPRLEALLQYYTTKSQRLWSQFRRAYQYAVATERAAARSG